MSAHPLDPLSEDEFRSTAAVLQRDKGVSDGWRFASIELAEPPKAKKKGYFLKTFSTTKKKGAVLKYRSSSIKRVALVVTKGKGYGTVKVYLGKHLLKKVSLAAKRTHKKKLVNIATSLRDGFAGAASQLTGLKKSA